MHMTEKMKKYRAYRLIALLLFLTIFLAVPAAAAYPKYDNYVGDEAGILSEHTVRTLRKYNETLKKDLGVSISVGTVKTTDGVEIGEYTRGLFKKWNLGDGILILIALDDEDFYFVQSKNLENLITNEDLAEVRDKFFEEDFTAGNIDRGILKTVTQMSSMLVSELEEAAEAEAKEEEESGEKKGTTAGSVIVGICIFFLCVVLIAVVGFAALFVAALFNDECAEFMRTKIFRRGQSRNLSYHYDERLYGNPQRAQKRDPYAQNRQILDQRRSNPGYNPHRPNYGGGLGDNYEGYQQRRPQQNSQQRPQRQDYQNALGQGQYYDAYGNARRNPQPRNGTGRPQNYNSQQGGYRQAPEYRAPQRQIPERQAPERQAPERQVSEYRAGEYRDTYRQQPQTRQPRQQNGDDGATRAFNIPGRGNY